MPVLDLQVEGAMTAGKPTSPWVPLYLERLLRLSVEKTSR
jgi:hypothetical protein